MDFGQILDEWDRRSPESSALNKDKDTDKDHRSAAYRSEAAARRRRLLRIPPDAVVDLHNYSREEAWTILDNFFTQSKEQGYEKLLIIHGKGNHEGSDGILKELTRKFIEDCPFAGESGYNLGPSGGSGATWVLIKNT